ncbi:MAG: phosphoribosylglycinamide formyltransferase [Phycisphaerales bacterium]
MTAAANPSRLRIAALISGGGRTVLNLLDAIEAGTLPVDIGVVISSSPKAAGVARLRERGLTVHCPPRDGHDAISAILRDSRIDLVCLAGYLRLFRVDPAFVGRVINIHPALLPDFGGRGMYGNHVHAAVLAEGRSETGCTVHVVDDRYDHGPSLLQRRCPVRPDDDVATLAARVFAEEAIAYPEAIGQFARGAWPLPVAVASRG